MNSLSSLVRKADELEAQFSGLCNETNDFLFNQNALIAHDHLTKLRYLLDLLDGQFREEAHEIQMIPPEPRPMRRTEYKLNGVPGVILTPEENEIHNL